MNYVGCKVLYILLPFPLLLCFIWTMWDVKKDMVLVPHLYRLRFIWTMWDVKSNIPTTNSSTCGWFYMNYVGCKAIWIYGWLYKCARFYMNYVCFLQMKIPHFCKMGAGKFASSLQHYNCIFQSCQGFANAHPYGLCPWHDFQIQLLKPYPAWQKSWKFFVAILGNFILQLTLKLVVCKKPMRGSRCVL